MNHVNGSTENGRLKVGLALGGGGARGFAHIGVLQTLLDHDIPIDVIAGTSIGAIIGCSYACGISPKKLAALLDSLDLHELLGVPKNPLPEMVERVASEMLLQKAGWRNGDRDKTRHLFEFFKLMTRNRNFDELNIPFAAVACDVDTGEEIAMDEGKVYRALAASAALPGVHDPVRWNGRLLVDGGIIDKVPVKVSVALGADVVIAVDVSSALSETVNTTIEVIVQSPMCPTLKRWRCMK
jgi:NTE family protein